MRTDPHRPACMRTDPHRPACVKPTDFSCKAPGCVNGKHQQFPRNLTSHHSKNGLQVAPAPSGSQGSPVCPPGRRATLTDLVPGLPEDANARSSGHHRERRLPSRTRCPHPTRDARFCPTCGSSPASCSVAPAATGPPLWHWPSSGCWGCLESEPWGRSSLSASWEKIF